MLQSRTTHMRYRDVESLLPTDMHLNLHRTTEGTPTYLPQITLRGIQKTPPRLVIYSSSVEVMASNWRIPTISDAIGIQVSGGTLPVAIMRVHKSRTK